MWRHKYHEDWGVALRCYMNDCQSLLVDCVNICPMLLQKHGKLDVAPEDCIVHTSEPLIVLTVQPGPFPLCCVTLRFSQRVFIVLFEKVLKGFVVVIVGSYVQDSGILVVEDGVDAFDVGAE